MREKELRIALVCFGGVSLAVYMHGISKEILKLVRASCALHGISDRAKRATILQAEGEKQSAILRAEGARQAVILGAEADQQSLILRAEGDRQSRALRARGEAEALEHVFDMVKKANILPSDMLGYKFREALPAVAAGDANKLLLLPSGASDGMGAVAGLGAAFAQGAAPDKEPEAPRRAQASQRSPRPG